jgi:CHAD domain-containing protein
VAAQDRPGSTADPDAPATSVRRRAAQVIDEQRAKIFAHVASAVDGRDPEGVHDMRVATRRMRAALKLFEPWLDPGDVARVGPAVRTLTRALGRVRELDVLRLRLAGLAAQGSAQRALAIESIDARLARRRRRARARMMGRFAKVDLDRLDARLQRLTAQLARHAPPQSSGGESVSGHGDPHRAAGEHEHLTPLGAAVVVEPDAAHDDPIARLLDAIAGPVVQEATDVCFASLPEEVGTTRGAEALHAVRIAAKKLRYTLEIVSPYLGDGGVAAVKRLRAAQDKLGDFHDDTVLDDVLRPEIERARERGRPLLGGELRALRTSRRRALLRDERAVRAALIELRDDDFVGLVRAALVAAGADVPELPAAATAPATAGDGAAVAGDAAPAAQPAPATSTPTPAMLPPAPATPAPAPHPDASATPATPAEGARPLDETASSDGAADARPSRAKGGRARSASANDPGPA